LRKTAYRTKRQLPNIMAAQILMVPIHLDALYLKKDRSVVETMADFSRLPYFDGKRDINPDVANLSEEILSQPFEDRGLQLQAGVHLHWALPDALTRGFQPRNKTANEHQDEHEHGNENERSISFPPVPNRWLVTRTDGTQEVKQWVVESDYLHPPGQIGPQKWISYPLTGAGAYVISSHPQPFHYIGRKVTLDSWRYEDKSAHQYLQKLTAVGYGEPTFAAFYPNCLSVFGFHDDAPPGSLQGVQYDVIGWYSEPEQDCLYPKVYPKALQEAFTQDKFNALKEEDKYKALKEVYRWVVEDPSGNPLPPFPTQTICYAHLSFEPDDTVDDRPEERKVAVAVGNTGTEALSAYLADFCARDPGLANKTPNPADLEDQLEAIHLASQFEGRIVDIGPKFREARHNKEFNGVMAGTLWTIRVEKTASGQANAHETATYAEDALPPEIATQLDGLNVCQKDFDRDCDEIESLRKQLFADWYKYMLCVYPPEGHRGPLPNHDEVKYFIEKNGLFPLQRRISKNNVLKFKRDQAFTNLYQAVAELQLLIPADIKDWAKFQKRFDKPALPEVERLCTLLPAGTVAFLTPPMAPSNEEKRKQTINDLNGVLKSRTLFKTVFGDRKDTLTGEAHSLAAQLPNAPIKTYDQLLRFNRLLLEAVFSEEITKSAPYALKSVPAPRYWQPNEPVVLIVDEVDQTGKQSPRHGQHVGLRKEDDLLRCDVIELKDAAINALFDEIRNKILGLRTRLKILELRTSLTSGFTVPAVGSAVAVTVENTARMGGSGYYIFVTPANVKANSRKTGAGCYRVASITDATHAVITNVGGRSNAKPGTVIALGANVSAKTRPGFTTWTEQPWHPFLLEWEVEVMPLKGKYKRSKHDDGRPVGRAYDPDCIIESYLLKDNAVDQVIQPGKEPVAKESNRYYGRSILTPYAKLQLINQIENFLQKQLLEDYYSSDYYSRKKEEPEKRTNDYFAQNIDEIRHWYESLDKKDAFLEQILPVYDYLRSEEDEDEPGFHLLAQSLSGFNEALLMQKQSLQLPVSDPLGFADYQPFTDAVRVVVGRSNRTAPQPHNDFNPIRTGFLKINQLRLVDTFGQVQTLNLQENRVITTDVMTSPANPHLAILPPRIVQPARLNFRWLAGDDDFALEESDDPEMNSHPMSTPICGWLLPNNLDNSLMVYNAQGRALGSLNRGGRWEPAPGGQRSVVRWPLPNPHLHRVISYLQEQETQGPGFLDTFLTVIENALDNIEPEYVGGHEALALLMGRPIAVARASLNLEVQGYPAIDEEWNVFRQDMEPAFQHESKDRDRETEDYTEVKMPIRIGEYQQLNDGLVGYWIEDDGKYRGDIFCAPQTAAKLEIKAGPPPGFDLNESFTLARKSNGINPVTQKVILKIGTFSVTIPPGSFRLNPYGRFAFQGTINGLSLQVQIAPLGNDIFTFKAEGTGVDLTGLTNPVTVVLTIGSDSDTRTVTAQSRLPANIAVHRDQQPLNITQSISSPPHKLTLLLDPRGAVHATSGILPTKAIQIPADQFVEALRNIEVTFLTAPILTDRGKINLPVPDEPGYVWSWCEKENGVWDKVTQIGQVTTEPTAATQELKEGWLKLTEKAAMNEKSGFKV
jgi:hypothetical protein